MKLCRNNKGFTLVELIVIIAVSAIVLTPFSMLITSSLRNEAKIQKTIQAQHETQSSFIVLNELCRGKGFASISVIDNYFSNGRTLRIDDKVLFLKSGNFVMQDFHATTEDTGSESVLNNFVNSLTISLTSDELEVVLNIDKDNDGSIDDTFNYRYAKRR